MTIRLLGNAAGYSANDIVTLDPATEAGLVAAKQATTSLAGGRVPPVPPRLDTASDARLVLRPDGVPRAIAGGNPDQWFPLVPAVARPNTVVLFGDSLMEQYNAATGYATSLTQTGGLATTVKSAHGQAVGDKARVSGATDARYNRPYEVTAVIDSSTIQFLVDPDCPATSTGNPYIVYNHRTTARCWAAHLNSRLDGRYQIINNAGIGGNTGAMMLARIQTDVLDFMPAEVWLNHGTNDVYAANLTVQQIIDTDKLIYDRLTTAGIIVRETSIPPRVGATAANIQKSLAVNRWRKEYWAGRSGGTYHDTYSPLVVATTGAVSQPTCARPSTSAVMCWPITSAAAPRSPRHARPLSATSVARAPGNLAPSL